MTLKTLSVSAIKEGTVIDHILAGQALKIIEMLQLAADQNQVTVGLNLESQSMGRKDLIKVENVFLDETQAGQIAVFAPMASVNVIENYQVVKKFRVTMPSAITAVLRCPNGRCVTVSERVSTYFRVEECNGKVWLRCKYCEKTFSRDQLRSCHD